MFGGRRPRAPPPLLAGTRTRTGTGTHRIRFPPLRLTFEGVLWSGLSKMKTFWGLVLLLVGAEGDLLELGTMLQEETGKSVLSYVFYGCYCGQGGTGQPLDATDRCCKTHDCCYGNLTACFPKVNPYIYTREDGVIICSEGAGETQFPAARSKRGGRGVSFRATRPVFA
ncbi:basic phospholipase A2 Tpu-G6D49-like [Liasis olivaceus]